jgi:DNA-binding response OmpR family regulator
MTQVLVIDDEKDIRETISNILKKHNYNPVTTDNVVDAEDLIRTKKWDIIISDVMIPHLGGFELVEVVKEVTKDTPVILVTGMDKEILSATMTNADIIITKPFTGKQLIDSIEELLGKQENAKVPD